MVLLIVRTPVRNMRPRILAVLSFEKLTKHPTLNRLFFNHRIEESLDSISVVKYSFHFLVLFFHYCQNSRQYFFYFRFHVLEKRFKITKRRDSVNVAVA